MAVGLRAAVPCRSTTAVRGEPVRFAQGKLPLHLPERPSLAFGAIDREWRKVLRAGGGCYPLRLDSEALDGRSVGVGEWGKPLR